MPSDEKQIPLSLPELKLPKESRSSSPEYAPYSPAPPQEYDPNASPIDFLKSPNNSRTSPEYAPYSPAPPQEYDLNASPINFLKSPRSPDYPPPNFNANKQRILSPRSPDYPPPNFNLKGGTRIENLKNKIACLSPGKQNDILKMLKDERLKKPAEVKGGSIFDVVDDIKTNDDNVSSGETKHINV